jgi:dienelactone hydrolase
LKRIILEQDAPNGVPVIVCAPQGGGRLPVVFYIHGFGGDKRGGLELAYNLAERDIITISLDAAMHGGRLDYRVATTWTGPQKGDIYPFETGFDRFSLIMKIISETVQDITHLREFFRQDQRMDVDRMGICGTSMGGFISYCFAAQDSDVKAMATLISFPTLLQRWQDSILEASLQPAMAEQMTVAANETVGRTKEIATLDPLEGLKTYAPKPLLMVCGGLDTDTHKSYSLRFYQQMKPLYADYPQNLQYKVHPNAGHRVTSAMVNDAVDWFGHQL